MTRLLPALGAVLGGLSLAAINTVPALAWHGDVGRIVSERCISATQVSVTATIISGPEKGQSRTIAGPASGGVVSFASDFSVAYPAMACGPKTPPPPPPVVPTPTPVTHPIDHKPPPPVPCEEGKEHPKGNDQECAPKPVKHVDCGKDEKHPKGDEEHCVPDVKPTPTPKQTPPPVASHPRENLPPPPVSKPQPPPAKVTTPVAAPPAPPEREETTNVPGPPVTGSGPDSYHLVKPAALADTASTPWPKLALLAGLTLAAIGGLIFWMYRRPKAVPQN